MNQPIILRNFKNIFYMGQSWSRNHCGAGGPSSYSCLGAGFWPKSQGRIYCRVETPTSWPTPLSRVQTMGCTILGECPAGWGCGQFTVRTECIRPNRGGSKAQQGALSAEADTSFVQSLLTRLVISSSQRTL